jgi:hypothetical protein
MTDTTWKALFSSSLPLPVVTQSDDDAGSLAGPEARMNVEAPAAGIRRRSAAQSPDDDAVAAEKRKRNSKKGPILNKHDFPNFTHICRIFSQLCVKMNPAKLKQKFVSLI